MFVELFAGSAAVTLALIGGTRLSPPVAYMGSKRYYAGAILGALGLVPGQGADAVILCDAGPWGWAWQALAVPETCRAVADVLRSWRREDPTALWKRLAAEPPPAEAVARAASVLWLQGRTCSNCPIWWQDGRWVMDSNGRTQAPASGARSAKDVVERSSTSPSATRGLTNPSTVAARAEAIADTVARWLAKSAGTHGSAPVGGPRGMHKLRPNPANVFSPQIPSFARNVAGLAEGVAAYLALSEGNSRGKPVTTNGQRWHTAGYAVIGPVGQARGFRERLRPAVLAADVDDLHVDPWPPLAVHHGDVFPLFLWLCLLGDLSGVVVYMDPPYVGCTGYAADCSRARVLAMARALSERGAVVAVSEAVGLAEDLGAGWEAIEITAARRGQVRSFARVKREFLTLNRVPAARVAEQAPLFAVGA